jgi:Mlc titration factor MtfA (ptsG expression regulator)
MLVTPQSNHRNRALALTASGFIALTGAVGGYLYTLPVALALFAIPVYVLFRRRIWRRQAVMKRPFPPEHERILRDHVAFYRALGEAEKVRFRQMVAVFLDEVRISGVGTDVDDTVRLLVAASAVIPVFGFSDWDYRRLGEVLIYPSSFSEKYEHKGGRDENILGLTGRGHLRGVMVLSKPDLLADFARPERGANVGIHEFVHEVEQEEVDRGLPAEVPPEAARRWVRYVAAELAHPSNRADANAYAYTNDREYLAVLGEYFFSAPDALKKKDLALYEMLRKLFHQDSASLLAQVAPPPRHQIARTDPCPCGSGKRYKDCCLRQHLQG